MSDPSASRTIDPAELERLLQQEAAPVHAWNPARRGEIDMRIARDGTWYYQGSPVNRAAMVRLFSTVLRREGDGSYWLVTPFEALRMRVDDAPFVGVELDVFETGAGQMLVVRTNVDDRVLIDEAHPLRVACGPSSGEPAPYVLVRDGLEALLSRNVFYQLVDLGERWREGGREVIGVRSAGRRFRLGDPGEES